MEHADMNGERRIAGSLCLGMLLALPVGAAPKKGVSLDDLVPTRPAARPRPTARKPAPRPVVRKPAALVAKKPVSVSPIVRAPGTTLTAGIGTPFRTIGAALLKAPAGARILVKAGTYRESLVLTKPVEIASARPEDVVIVEGGARPGVVMKTGSATLRHLTLRQTPGTGQAAYAVDVPQGALTLEDCTVDSGALACVGVHGEGARSSLRKCRLQGSMHGLFVDQKAQATLDDCTLSNNGGNGALISGGGTANLHACRVADNGAQGLVFKEGAQALIDDCNITGNKAQGVLIESDSEPVLRTTRVFRNTLAGVLVGMAGKGLLQDCDLYENGGAGLVARMKGTIIARNSKFRANRSEGVVCVDGGSARIEDGTILDNGAVAIGVWRGSELVLTKGRVVAKGLDAVLINGKSSGTFDNCDIAKAPGGAGAAVHEESNAIFRFCKFRGGKWGLLSTTGSDLLIDDCDVTEVEGHGLEMNAGTGQIRSSRLFRNQGSGITVAKSTQFSVSRCELYGNQDSNFIVTDGGAPKVSRSLFRDSGRAGILISAGSGGVFDYCETRNNTMAGVAIQPNSKPEFRNCRIVNGKGPQGDGVWIDGPGTALFEECTIQSNGGAGVTTLKRADPLFRRCRINDNGGAGLRATDFGLGTVENSEILRNRGGSAINLDTGKLTLRATRTE